MKKISDSQWEKFLNKQTPIDNKKQFLEALAKIPDNIEKENKTIDEKKTKYQELSKKFKVNIDSTIDLHMKTKKEAELLIGNFIFSCIKDNDKFILIIHGKGKHSKGVGVLKTFVKQLLDEKFKNVIDWYSNAPKSFGGNGAVIIKLKNKE